MPKVKVPLVGSYNQRGLDGNAALILNDDQRFKNCTFGLVQNPITGKATAYLEKRPGIVVDSTFAGSNPSTGIINPDGFSSTVSAFGDTNSTIYQGTISAGVITGRGLYFTEVLISSMAMVMIRSSDGTGWYLPEDAIDQTAYTGDTHTNTTIDGIASTAGMYSGQLIAGTGIVVGTRILTVNNSTTITTDTATTGTATVAITKEPVAKIIDADFTTTGTYVSAFQAMDGYLFYTDNTNLRNSDLNSATAYTSTAFKATDMDPDPNTAIEHTKNYVIVFGKGSFQAFQNAGYATGSPMERIAQSFSHRGAVGQDGVTRIEDTVFFVSSPTYGDAQIFKMEGFATQKVSTAEVDRIIGTTSITGGTIYLSACQLGGYPYLVATISSASERPNNILQESGEALLLETGDNILLEGDPASVASFVRQLVYNIKLNIWSEWDSTLMTYVVGQKSGSSNAVFTTSRFDTLGRIFRINPTADGNVYSDNGTAYTTEIRTSKLNHGTEARKFVREISIIADSQSSGTVTLEANDNDYDSSSWKTLGTFNLTNQEKRITRCGSYEGGRAYRLTHSNAVAFRAEALEITYDLGKP